MSSTERVRRHRETMSRTGFRLVQLRVPDTRTREFQKRIAREREALRLHPDPVDEEWDSLGSWDDIKPARVRTR